jgi:hypothetical protein
MRIRGDAPGFFGERAVCRWGFFFVSIALATGGAQYD